MRIAIRADAGQAIGTGHLRRCLSLAEALTGLGAEPRFIIRHDAVAQHMMAASPYPVSWLQAAEEPFLPAVDSPPHAAWAQVPWQRDAAETISVLEGIAPDWLVVDHYAFDAAWHREVRGALGCAILAIDDLGDRSLAADILLDANAALSHTVKYNERLTPKTRMLVGPRFALLAQAYRNAPCYAFSDNIRSIGVFMGGADAYGASSAVLRALRNEAGFRGEIEIVSTSANPRLEALQAHCAANGNAELTLDLPDLSSFYARHDLQIGAGGTSSYERCYIGVPTIAMVLAANQLAVVPMLADLGVVRGATLAEVEATLLLKGVPALGQVVRDLIINPEQRRVLSSKARSYVDGRGAERVALAMVADRLTVRPARSDDTEMVYRWRNDASTRAVSLGTAEIAYDDHLRWMAATLAAPDRALFVAVVGPLPVGVIRFDLRGNDTWEVSLYTDPGLHGLGLGTRMLLAGETALIHAGHDVSAFYARIVSGNEVSTKMFERAGYKAGDGGYLKVAVRNCAV